MWQWASLIIWKPCKRCGLTDIPDVTCSYCGGFGMTGHEQPDACYRCGGSGQEWPIRCRCGAYRGFHEAFFHAPQGATC